MTYYLGSPPAWMAQHAEQIASLETVVTLLSVVLPSHAEPCGLWSGLLAPIVQPIVCN